MSYLERNHNGAYESKFRAITIIAQGRGVGETVYLGCREILG